LTEWNPFYRLRTPVGRNLAIKPKTGYCINCDNKHGCKSRTPPCIDEMAKNGVKGVGGKHYFIEQKKTHNCPDCPFFRSCWNEEEFDRSAK